MAGEEGLEPIIYIGFWRPEFYIKLLSYITLVGANDFFRIPNI